jgi:hypothetical protein
MLMSWASAALRNHSHVEQSGGAGATCLATSTAGSRCDGIIKEIVTAEKRTTPPRFSDVGSWLDFVIERSFTGRPDLLNQTPGEVDELSERRFVSGDLLAIGIRHVIGGRGTE